MKANPTLAALRRQFIAAAIVLGAVMAGAAVLDWLGCCSGALGVGHGG